MATRHVYVITAVRMRYGKLIALVCSVILSERIVSRVKMCEIRDEIYGASDHCPLVLEIAPVAES